MCKEPMWSVNDIQVLLHFHVSPEPHPRAHATAVQETIAMLVRNGMIEERKDFSAEPNCYQTTVRGQAWVEMLKNTPFPVCVWMDPRTIPDKEEN
jgi:hypothetical protein